MIRMTSKNINKHAPKDNGNPAIHTNYPEEQKKNIFLSHATQLLLRLLPNNKSEDAKIEA